MRNFARFLGLIGLGLAAIAVLTYPAWLVLHPWADFPFHRIGERIGMLTLLLGFVACARRWGLADRQSLGFGISRPRFMRELLRGLGLGAISLSLVVFLMNALGLLDWTIDAYGAAATAKVVCTRLASALAVAFIEETFLRGAMLTAIERESGSVVAVGLTSLVYSATHFFASFHIPAASVDSASGLELLAGTLHLFAHPARIVDAFLCLFAVGAVLGMVRVATGNIAACIGLHAGWVWVMLTVHEFSQPVRTAPWGFLLSRFDGFVGWLVLVWTCVVGYGLQRLYANGASWSSR